MGHDTYVPVETRRGWRHEERTEELIYMATTKGHNTSLVKLGSYVLAAWNWLHCVSSASKLHQMFRIDAFITKECDAP
jgi:hypothetical protein